MRVSTDRPRGRVRVLYRPPLIDPSQEYTSLRQEMGQAAKFIVERPLAIATIGALLLSSDKDLRIVLPTVISSLLLFNFAFTVNRVWSAARAAGYIRVALEGRFPWRGWETSLEEYRTRWRNQSFLISADVVDKPVVPGGSEAATGKLKAPGALMYYSPIFWLHVSLVSVCLYGGSSDWWALRDKVPWYALVPLVVSALLFGYLAVRNGPKSASHLVELNIHRWQIVFTQPSAAPFQQGNTQKPEAPSPRAE